jgi:hypothetical protein
MSEFGGEIEESLFFVYSVSALLQINFKRPFEDNEVRDVQERAHIYRPRQRKNMLRQ